MENILFLINTLNSGGAEQVLVDIVNNLSMKDYKITVQTIFDTGDYRKSLSSKVNYIPGFKIKKRITNAIFYRFLCLLPARVLSRLIIKKEYDYEVAFLEGLPTKVIAGGTRKTTKRIAWVHTDLYSYYGNKYVFGSVNANIECYKKYNKIICVSEGVKESFKKRFGDFDNLIVRYNPLDKEQILYKSNLKIDGFDLDDNGFKLVAVGRLVDQKGFDYLIESISIIKRVIKEKVSLYIIGDGPDRDKLNKLIEKYDLTNNVHLCGKMDNPYNLMKKCDVMVISSRAEGYSLVLCEALIICLPVVSTNVTGPSEILNNAVAGLLVNISAEALADGLKKIIEDRNLYRQLKKNAEIWSNEYNPNIVYSQIESIFKEGD